MNTTNNIPAGSSPEPQQVGAVKARVFTTYPTEYNPQELEELLLCLCGKHLADFIRDARLMDIYEDEEAS